MYIRTTKTSSHAQAVQVVSYKNRKLIIEKHIGSAHTEDELTTLKNIAKNWIQKHARQRSLFDLNKTVSSQFVSLDKCQFLGVYQIFAYEILKRIFSHFKFTHLNQPLLIDLAIIRIFEPASKLRSLQLLSKYFNIHHSENTMYKSLSKFIKFKSIIEKKTIRIAQSEFQFDYSFVFYDVTTLYFESFEPDDLRKMGFSKDNKSNQPQITIGLVVNKDGFPVAYDVFEGNTFEGNTFLPVILKFKEEYKINNFTVVADAAMLSISNLEKLREQNLQYIVGARTANISPNIIKNISDTLNKINGATMRMTTTNGDLVCEFSTKRYNKNKREMDKQMKKAEAFIKNPSSIKKTKFLMNTNNQYSINQKLIEKTELLLGIKGYYTNLVTDDTTIIDHYHNLWRVEHAFRIAKNDLEMRPIFHYEANAIKTHILICFMALAVSKYMELKTGQSLRSIIDLIKNITDARILNTLTNEEIVLRSAIKDDVRQMLDKLNLSY